MEKINKFINKIVDFLKNNIKNLPKMIVTYIKDNLLFLVFVFTSLINSSLLRFLTVKNFTDFGPLLADFGSILIIGALGYLFKPKNRFKYYFTFSIITTVICVINSMYYTNYYSFASVSLLATSLQVIDVGDAVVQNVMELKDFSYIWQIVAMIFLNLYLKKNKDYNNKKELKKGKVKLLNTLLVGIITLFIFTTTLTKTDIGRLTKQWNREASLMRFGLYVYQANDIVTSIKTKLSPLFGYDEAAKKYRDFYEKRWENEKTSNEYTDIFKGMNIITIHAESIQGYTLDTSFNGLEVTPNLNKLRNEGIYFSNFYAQESVGTSSDTEFTVLTSLLPSSSGTVAVSYWDRDYPTILKELKKKDYYTFSMHANNGTMWNRNVIHPKYGFNKFFNYTNDYVIDEELGLGLSDISFFNQSVPKIKQISENNTNFYGNLIMLTNHTPFVAADVVDYDVDYKYEKIDEETGETVTVSAPYLEGTTLGNYLKTVHYADDAIGKLIEGLDEAGVLENTVIVIYGDHDSKIKKSEYKRFYNYDPYTDTVLSKDDENYKDVDYYTYELNRKVPLIIWTKNKQFNLEVNKVMGMYDVAPTLANMFGFETKYALGHDIFSIDENIVVLPNGNWITDKMYYSSSKNEGKLLNETETVEADYISKNCAYAEELISISDSIIVYDMIKKTTEADALLDKK